MERWCVWPNCLNEAQAARLAAEIERELSGEPVPDPDLTDYRGLHKCVEPPPGVVEEPLF